MGATFTVDLNGKVSIGLSSRMTFDYDSWLLLQNEIVEARKYLSKVKMTGKHPGVKDVEKTIKPSQYEENGIYLDIKGRVILYLGEGEYINCRGRIDNRLDCYYCYAILDKVPDNLVLVNDRTVILNVDCDFDSYRGKPTKLVKKITQLPKSVSTFYREQSAFICHFRKFDL